MVNAHFSKLKRRLHYPLVYRGSWTCECVCREVIQLGLITLLHNILGSWDTVCPKISISSLYIMKTGQSLFFFPCSQKYVYWPGSMRTVQRNCEFLKTSGPRLMFFYNIYSNFFINFSPTSTFLFSNIFSQFILW